MSHDFSSSDGSNGGDEDPGDVGIHTPTRNRIREWDSSFREHTRTNGNSLSDVMFINLIPTNITNLQDITTQEAAIRVIFEVLQNTATAIGVDVDIFLDATMQARARELHNLVHGHDTSDESSDTDEDSRLGNQDDNRRQRSPSELPDAPNSLAVDPDQSTAQNDAQSAWIAAYTNLAWVNGDGRTRTGAAIVGKLPKEPVLSDCAIAISATGSKEDAADVRAEFHDWLCDYRWQGVRSRRTIWMRFHPWVVRYLCQIFFHDFVGMGFFRQINRVLTTYTAPSAENLTRVHASRARTLVETEGDQLPALATKVLKNFAQVLDHSFGHDAYSQFQKTFSESSLLLQYNSFIKACIDQPRGPEARVVRTALGRATAPGVDWRSLVKDYFGLLVQSDGQKFSDVVFRAKPLLPFITRYGGAVLILFARGSASQLTKCGLNSLDAVCAKFDELVPEFGNGMQVMAERVIKRMRKEDDQEMQFLVDNKYSTAIGNRDGKGGSWYERVVNTYAGNDGDAV